MFARVGGANDPNQQQMKTDVMVQINTSYVIYDNAWLWRADHGITGTIYNSANPVKTGLQVNADHVIAYGLAAEHTLGNLVEWNGEDGHVYFYQSEFPYDVTQENYGNMGYSAYYVKDTVERHYGWGIGVYSYFRDHAVNVQSGIKAPVSSEVKFVDALTVFLNGNGAIDHVIDTQGNTVSGPGQTAYVCNFDASTQ